MNTVPTFKDLLAHMSSAPTNNEYQEHFIFTNADANVWCAAPATDARQLADCFAVPDVIPLIRVTHKQLTALMLNPQLDNLEELVFLFKNALPMLAQTPTLTEIIETILAAWLPGIPND